MAAVFLMSLTVGTATVRAQSAPASPTFARDVAPILQKSCQRCHRPNSIGPMPLLTYEQARPWARSIRAKVASREMPPWFIDRNVGIRKFKNDPSLSDTEIALITRWVDGGAPQGNPADMPPPIDWGPSDRWSIKPNLIVNLKKDVVVKANDSDQWWDLEMEPTGITEDRYIKAIEIKPTKGVPTVHHANAHAEMADGTSTGSLVEYAVGKGGEIYPEGSAKVLPADGKMVINVHVHSNGEETLTNLAVGFELYPPGYKPKTVHLSRMAGNTEDIDIPPGESNARVDGYNILQSPIRITAFQPHMHNRGKRQCLEVIYPPSATDVWPVHRSADRARSEIISCADWRFNWHLSYTYEDDEAPLLPAGTVLHVTSWYDNSPGNKGNPDPNAWIGFGQRSIDEMGFAFLTVNTMTEDEYQAAVRERLASRKRSSQQP
jgi:hypothetical protein